MSIKRSKALTHDMTPTAILWFCWLNTIAEKNGKEAPIKVTIRSTIYSFLLNFLALVDRNLLLSDYLGNSFPQTEQLPKPAVHYGEGGGSSRALLHDCKKLREPSFPALGLSL